MHDDSAFGRRLRQLRRVRGLTQEALAQAAFCALDTVKKIEAGRRQPSRQMAAQLADVLELGADTRAAFLAAARPGDGPDGDQANPPAATIARRHLPRALTPFIGRDRELADLLRLIDLPDARLITVVAPGGMGKTRLALAAAAHLRDEETFPDGVAFAALAPLGDPAGLDVTLADALGLPLGAGDPRNPRAQLLDFLRAKELLLVLDNCEHLADAVAALAGAILAEAPGVTLLATSRERLGLRVEQMLPLDGMVTKADGALLFATTARTAQPAFVLNELTRPQVAAICARVGGMPLAIELAAGWADTLSLAEIAAELDHGDELLASVARDLPERQRSVRAVCDSTWGRLNPQEQAVFAQVAVFRDGGTRRALQAVTGASLGQLQALVGKALLRYDPERERYSVHELLRQYAQERLAKDAAAEQGTQARHAAYYLEALATREAALKGAGQREALEQIGRDIENVHTAWGWAVDHGALDLLAGAVGCLSLAYEWLGRSEDGLDAFSRAAASVGAAPAEVQARLLAAQARFSFLRGDRAYALALLEQAQSMLDGHAGAEVDLARAHALLQLGHCMADQGYATAHDAYTRSQALFEADGDQWGAAAALTGLGSTALNLSPNYALAQHLLEQSVERYRVLGEQIGLSETLTTLSQAARYLGHVPESLALAREAHALAQASSNPFLIAITTSNLGITLYWTTAMEEAYTVLRTALAITLDLGFQAELSNCYYRLGNAARGVRRYAESRAAYTQALAVAQQLGAALTICYIQIGLSYVALSEGNDAEALRLAEEVLALSIQLGEGQNQRFALRNGALATRRLGEAQRAKGYVVRGLRLALATRQWAVCLGAVVLLLADSGAPEYAAALFDHAGWTHQVGNDTDSEDTEMREIRAILAALPPDVSAAAQARWAGYDYWAMLTELLAELEARGWGG